MPNGTYYPGQCAGSDDCTRPIVVRKSMLCNTHYMADRRKNADTGECKLEWCEGKVYAKSLCRSHYQRQSQGLPFIDPREPVPTKTCAGPECDRQLSMRNVTGLCKSHYIQQYLGKPLTPLITWETRNNGDKRLCRTCKEWKDHDKDFYRASNGGKQGECKPCFIRRNSANQRARKLRKQGVSV